MQQLESGLVGVVCGWNRSWGAKNDLCELLTVIGLRVVNDVGGARLLRKGRPVDHQERTQASLGHELAAALRRLREGALGARIWPFAPAYGGGPDRRYGLRAARRKPNSVKEHDLNLYVTLFISSLCTIAAEHGVTSSVQKLVNPAVRNNQECSKVLAHGK